MNRNSIILQNANRLAIMRKLSMVDTEEEPFFDRLTYLASQVIGVPVSLVSMVAANYQFFKSSSGLPEPWKSQRRTPLSHSFCQHVVETGQPLVVKDAREHPVLKTNLAIPDLNVIGYLGIPIHTPDGYQLGSFCVIDSEPHDWTEEEIEVMQAFAEVVNAEIDTRGRAYQARQLETHVEQMGSEVNYLFSTIQKGTPREQIIRELNTLRDKLHKK